MDPRTFKISPNLLLFWLKDQIKVTQRDIQLLNYRTFLGLIPLGKKEQTIPLRTVSEVIVDTRYRIGRIIFGLIMFFGAFTMRKAGVPVIIVYLLIGLLFLFDGIRMSLTIQRAGSDFTFEAPLSAKGILMDIKDAITEALNYEADKTDLYIHAEKIGEAVGRNINN